MKEKKLYVRISRYMYYTYALIFFFCVIEIEYAFEQCNLNLKIAF